jgi:protease II
MISLPFRGWPTVAENRCLYRLAERAGGLKNYYALTLHQTRKSVLNTGKNFGLYKTRVRDERKWEVLIPAREQVMLEGFTLFTDWLVVEERQRGLTSIRQINRKTREVVGIAFDDPAYVTWIGYNPEPETSRLRYGYSSMTTPDTLFELDMDTGERHLQPTGR